MASKISFVEFVMNQLDTLEDTRYKKMFGEYTIYCNQKVVALICNNQLFVKQTEAGKKFIGDFIEAPPYKGAKPAFLIKDQVEDKEWISQLIRLTEKEMPMPKPKKRKQNHKTQVSHPEMG